MQSLDKDITVEGCRKVLGTIGLEGNNHLQAINNLSGGQKARVLFASLFVMKPNLVLLDEPTNHLDITTINALIKCINNYSGAVIIVTHDIQLIEETCCQIYEIEDNELKKTDFDTYYDKVINTIDNN